MQSITTTIAHHLAEIIDDMNRWQDSHQLQIEQVATSNQASARNLVDYLGFRSQDRTRLQAELSAIGLSSLGRSEAAIRAQINRISDIIEGLQGDQKAVERLNTRPPQDKGSNKLRRKSEELFGPCSNQRNTRIMVTMPGSAASSPEIISQFLQSGMNVARINCAHDNPDIWRSIAMHIRRLSKELDQPCKIMMDLAGPKPRTGPMPAGAQVVKVRPHKDTRGRSIKPAKIVFYSHVMNIPPSFPDAVSIPLLCDSFNNLPPIKGVKLYDTRDKSRKLDIIEQTTNYIIAICNNSVVFETAQIVYFKSASNLLPITVAPLPAMENFIYLQEGDPLFLTGDNRTASPATCNDAGDVLVPATISCAVKEVIEAAQTGHQIKMDDGKFTAVVEQTFPDKLKLKITEAPPLGAKLKTEKGLNFPDTELPVNGLTSKDINDLETISDIADIVALSFVNRVNDIEQLQQQLQKPGHKHLGIILKIETRRAFEHLPELLLSVMQSEHVGVMIARGDLGVEVGWRHMAELQEEILWLCAAAHIPSIWATQVLEKLAKQGRPSRAEITDAAMAQRAECVMLNKGPYIHKAVRMLNRIIRTMDTQQYKKSARLPRLKLYTQTPRAGRPTPRPEPEVSATNM
ncbi:pyruvate kinase [Endozoicomonas montiporae]|uniref:pyruvate kinase n=1 Tax=Endozoicomonas montiporae CL-33 TaxID=570277 RepID=A0A142BDC9_9GAMM|nr:pyruvate kinase [Endozoicomonas montiporae]AMO56755.1 pyruvate kinase [Endozoicomonas montiporae CL-33]